MCGRFALFMEAGAFLDIFGCPPPDELEPRYNIVPDRDIVVVRAGGDGREAVRMRWGLLPPWAKDPADRGRQINARSETVFEKPSFKSAALRHRCLIPASGFFEWQKGGGKSQPYFIHRADGAPLAMAGIWRESRFGDDVLESCAILTMDAHPSIAGIHHRMPVMLRASVWESWIDPQVNEIKSLRQALQVLPEDEVTARPVGHAVNNPANEGARLIDRQDAPPAPAQGALF
jgi:putative SOS response-associated peptidase YedK